MDSLQKFGQYVRHHRLRKGLTQKALSLRIFERPNPEYIGRLERGALGGITFATCDKILLALDLEMRFDEVERYVHELHRRY